VNIYEIGIGNYWTGAVRQIDDLAGAPTGWTRTIVPELAVGHYAFWAGEWQVITDLTDPPNQIIYQETSLTDKQGMELLIKETARLIQTQRIMVQMVSKG
jgi:hypothetical protein